MTARDTISKALFISDVSNGWGKDASEIGDACYAVADVVLGMVGEAAKPTPESFAERMAAQSVRAWESKPVVP